MNKRLVHFLSEVMAMLPVTLMGARLGREVMVLKTLSISELAAEGTLYFKNALMGQVSLKKIKFRQISIRS